MGFATCDKEPSRPRKYTVEYLANQPELNVMGGVWKIDSGCGSVVSASETQRVLEEQGLTWPQHEFEFAGQGGSCSMCSLAYGCRCHEAGGHVPGKTGALKRVGFTADPVKCCLGQGKRTSGGLSLIDNDATCNPDYDPTFIKSGCDSVMLNYCSTGNWETPVCRQWVDAALTNGRSEPNTGMKTYCKQGYNFAMNSGACKAWCAKTQSTPGMDAECDEVVLDYCSRHPEDPNCGCLKSPPRLSAIEKAVTLPKVCWYKPCQDLNDSTFLPSNMRHTTCVSSTCVIEAGDIDIKGEQNTINFLNTCAAQYDGKTTITTGTQPSQPSKPSSNTPSYGYIISGVLGCIVIGIILIVIVIVISGDEE